MFSHFYNKYRDFPPTQANHTRLTAHITVKKKGNLACFVEEKYKERAYLSVCVYLMHCSDVGERVMISITNKQTKNPL